VMPIDPLCCDPGQGQRMQLDPPNRRALIMLLSGGLNLRDKPLAVADHIIK
jgi:hypothetical protein